tara:strand:- start:205 stop:537 length:333 start_codon:yes stop_codon:yes gene_type:complete
MLVIFAISGVHYWWQKRKTKIVLEDIEGTIITNTSKNKKEREKFLSLIKELKRVETEARFCFTMNHGHFYLGFPGADDIFDRKLFSKEIESIDSEKLRKIENLIKVIQLG